jgi:hypothetical protein
MTVSISWIEVAAVLFALAGDVASIELPQFPSIWLVGAIGLIVLPIATFIFQQIVGSVITGETWNLWLRVVRSQPSPDTVNVPKADLESLIRQGEQAIAVIEDLRAENEYLLAMALGTTNGRPVRGGRVVAAARRGRSTKLNRGKRKVR